MIILNEKEYAEKCIRTKAFDGKLYFTLGILAKYYYSEGYRQKEIINLLADFTEKSYHGYSANKANWNRCIEKIAINAGQYPLYEIDGVWITASEVEQVASLKNQSLEQVLFTILCIAKLNCLKNPNNQGWVSTCTKDIFDLARVSCSALKREEVIGALYEMGLLELPKDNTKLSMKVTFINNESEKALFVSDFRELGYEWLCFRGEKFIRCQECKVLTRHTKNRKYCRNCASQEPQEMKSVICVDCGKRFEVDSKNNQSCRCFSCYEKYRREYYKINKRKMRKNVHSTN